MHSISVATQIVSMECYVGFVVGEEVRHDAVVGNAVPFIQKIFIVCMTLQEQNKTFS